MINGSPRGLQTNYDFLPDGYDDTLVLTETLDEIMADKLVSLVNTQHYVRHRDIWDLRWLKQAGAAINHGWVNNKIDDYRVNDYDLKLESIRQRLPVIIHGEGFKLEMARFLPMDVQERTFMKDKFCDYLASKVRGLMDEVKRGILTVR